MKEVDEVLELRMLRDDAEHFQNKKRGGGQSHKSNRSKKRSSNKSNRPKRGEGDAEKNEDYGNLGTMDSQDPDAVSMESIELGGMK